MKNYKAYISTDLTIVLPDQRLLDASSSYWYLKKTINQLNNFTKWPQEKIQQI